MMHSSLMPDHRVLHYIDENCKYYYMPLHKDSLVEPIVQQVVGLSNHKDRSESEILASLIKAEKAQYSHIKIPFDRGNSEQARTTLEFVYDFSMGVVLQVFTSFLDDAEYFEMLMAMNPEFKIELVVDAGLSGVEEKIINLVRSGRDCHVSIPVHRDLNWEQLYSKIVFDQFKDIHLYFSYQLSPDSRFLNCKEAHGLIGQLRKQFPRQNFLPPKGVDIWDHRARHDFDMEPFVLPCYQTQSENPNIEYSVIIPTFNNQNHLRVVLRHLYRQNVGLDNFEVIVVDDGGTDQTQSLVMELLNSFPRPMNFKYIFFPRVRKRTMGDSQYRAGISRNLGVKNAEGEYLCFLDSDIIVPVDYLQNVGQQLQKWDALQARRINLSQAASSLDFEYEKVNRQSDTIPDEAYWEDFIKQKDWHLIPYNWKYVCTHSFSMRRDLFWKIGGLKRNFIFYGFEDTDLGYRLVKRGYRLHLLDVEVFHMFHENTRSEFMNLSSFRHTLLSRTAQIFYLHHFDEDIFENLLGLMEPEPTFGRLMRRVTRTLSLQFLWRPKSKVYRSLRSLN